MEKLKVILLAILTLAVSTSAAVTGTVAWFTATRLRTVAMNNITAVNPEEGLDLVSITSLNNVIGTNLEDDGTLTEPTVTPTIKQATYMFDHDSNPETDEQETAGYLRDASVDVENGVVYRADLDEGGQVIGYSEQDIGAADTKTFNGKKVFYATSFTANFKVSREDSSYSFDLFLDINKSSATRPVEEDTDSERAASIYNGIRFGFKTTDNWFVWAPFTETNIGASNTGNTVSKYVNDEVTVDNTHALTDAEALYTVTKFVKGNDQPDNTINTLDDSEHPLAKALVTTEASKVTANYGWLGQLSTTAKAVTVYTWFEGNEPDVIFDNFANPLSGLTSELKFIMRRVSKS